MIEAGHTQVMDYGYSYFVMALNQHQIIKEANRKDTAIAFRIARNASDREWSRFLKRR